MNVIVGFYFFFHIILRNQLLYLRRYSHKDKAHTLFFNHLCKTYKYKKVEYKKTLKLARPQCLQPYIYKSKYIFFEYSEV